MLMRKYSLLFALVISIIGSSLIKGADTRKEPVTPNASQEVKTLLEFFYDISGKFTLTGQHNFPNTKDRNSQFAADYIGKTPAVYSQDWGFAEDGDKDSYLARPDIVEEVIRQHKLGSIITICWHAVPPTANEPVTFRPSNDNIHEDSLASVSGNLTDQQFADLLTEGTDIYEQWLDQVDEIAEYLKKLEEEKIPVLWRPYHEMNGDWFWWGGRIGEYSTKRLYIQLYDRLVNYHEINNLIWVWSVDRPSEEGREFSKYYPGDQYLDMLALDVYGNDFHQDYYDSLLALSNGKPLTLGEVGNPPSPEILNTQPNWTFYVTWAGMVRNTLKKDYDVLVNDARYLNLNDPVYWGMMAPYRDVCGLEQLPVEQKKENFIGEWIFNEGNSTLDSRGAGQLPYKLTIEQSDDEIIINKLMIVEYDENNIIEEKLKLDSSEHSSIFWNSPKITTANMVATGDTLTIESKITFNFGGESSESTTKEIWTMLNNGKSLSIEQHSNSRWGERDIILIYDLKSLGY